jgi:rusticyanin
MVRVRSTLTIAMTAMIAAGLGAAIAVVATRSSPTQPAVVSGPSYGSSYSYYRSMMSRFGTGSMMGGANGSMMGGAGYRWMMGSTAAPGWMRGGTLPSYMMGVNTDPGKVMGRLFADAPGPRVNPAAAPRLGNEVPAGATVASARHRITFSGRTARLVVLASPAGSPDETFRAAGLVDPTIVVRAGTQVSIELVNADPDTAHGLVVSTARSASSWAPMMTAAPAFAGSALWFLGDPTSAGMHAGTLRFTAATAGNYEYLCTVPSHAQKGMRGVFVVTG